MVRWLTWIIMILDRRIQTYQHRIFQQEVLFMVMKVFEAFKTERGGNAR
jgi:hypothetical protein